jgi:hypothetical protein
MLHSIWSGLFTAPQSFFSFVYDPYSQHARPNLATLTIVSFAFWKRIVFSVYRSMSDVTFPMSHSTETREPHDNARMLSRDPVLSGVDEKKMQEVMASSYVLPDGMVRG